MIFERALLREFASLAAAVFLMLFAISVTTRLIRLLGQAAGGKIPSDAVIAFLGFFALYALPVLLSLTLFIAVLMTLGRWYRDSEMVIWFNAGQSLGAWLRPVLKFSLPLVVLIAVLSLAISPWAAEMSEKYRSRIDARDDVARVSPGVFGESSSKDRVFFVESLSPGETDVRNVFISSVQLGRSGVMISRTGRTELAANGDRFLVLENGRRYEGNPGEADYHVMEFERYATRIESSEGSEPEATPRNRSTLALIQGWTDAYRGEMVWRIGVPVSALLLALLAIPLSFVNPRAGRSLSLIFALLIYVVYSNLLTLSQARVAQSRLDFGIGLWLVHGVMLAVLVFLFVRRANPFLMRWR